MLRSARERQSILGTRRASTLCRVLAARAAAGRRVGPKRARPTESGRASRSGTTSIRSRRRRSEADDVDPKPTTSIRSDRDRQPIRGLRDERTRSSLLFIRERPRERPREPVRLSATAVCLAGEEAGRRVAGGGGDGARARAHARGGGEQRRWWWGEWPARRRGERPRHRGAAIRDRERPGYAWISHAAHSSSSESTAVGVVLRVLQSSAAGGGVSSCAARFPLRRAK